MHSRGAMQLRGFSDLRDLLRLGLSRSLASLVIKILTAGLTYATYVLLSRVMSQHEYGYFAFGISLATVLAIGASMGQQTAILRYWPEEQVAGRPEKAIGALRAGGGLTVLAGVALSLSLLAVARVFASTSSAPEAGHLYAAAALVLPLALAEYFSSALRAQGSVWTALAPRDLIWRTLLPLLAGGLFLLGFMLAGWSALLLTAAVLALALLLQGAMAARRGYRLAPGFDGIPGYWRERGTASRWFLLGTVIDAAALNVDTILVGLLLSPEDAAIYFNAFKTAGLLTLFMFAITLVVAPMVAQHYHAGEMRKAQAVTALCAWAGFLFSLAVFVIFAVFAEPILSLFGGSHESGTTVLILLGIGLLFDAATGPSQIVMMMTGRERAYVAIFGSIMVAGMIVAVVVIPVFGIVGAAAVNMGSRAVAQVAIAWWSRRYIGLDTSLLGIFRINRLRDAAPAAAH